MIREHCVWDIVLVDGPPGSRVAPGSLVRHHGKTNDAVGTVISIEGDDDVTVLWSQEPSLSREEVVRLDIRDSLKLTMRGLIGTSLVERDTRRIIPTIQGVMQQHLNSGFISQYDVQNAAKPTENDIILRVSYRQVGSIRHDSIDLRFSTGGER